MRLVPLTLVLVPVAAFGLVALAGPRPSGPAATVKAATLKIDPGHSNVIFKCKHNGASWFYGRFGDISGTIQFDDGDPKASNIEIVVKADSVDTKMQKLNDHLKSPDFFDAKQFPEISFKSTKVAKGRQGYKVTGDLSLHGVTKPVTVDVEHVGTGDARGKKVVGFHTVFTIDRTDYGVSYGAGGPLGSDVELIISLEAYGE